jgi:hypothetical protein
MDTTDISGLPKPLQVIIQQLFANNSLKSWIVYSNKYEQLVLNVKFDICEPGLEDVHEQACLFRRVSGKQQSRNIARAATHNKKRKLNPSTPEQPRDTVDNCHFTIIDSPESVIKDDNYTMIHKEEYHDIEHKEEYQYVQLPLTSPQPHVEPVEYPQAVAASEPMHDIYPEPVVAVTPPPPIPTTHIENDCSPSTNTVSESEEYHDHDSEEYHDCPNTPVSEEMCQPEPNHHIKCPCCNEKMTPLHTCSLKCTDNLSKMPSISTKSVGTPFPSPPLTSKMTIVSDPKPPDQPPLGLRWVSRRMPIPSDKCQHLQPCMFC